MNYHTNIKLGRYTTIRFHHKAAFTSEREQNANAACENDVNVRCRRIPEVRQIAFGCVTNVRQTAECCPSTVGTSKGICLQYIYVESIRCFGECQTIYAFTHMNVRIIFACHVRVRIPMQTRLYTITARVLPTGMQQNSHSVAYEAYQKFPRSFVQTD